IQINVRIVPKHLKLKGFTWTPLDDALDFIKGPDLNASNIHDPVARLKNSTGGMFGKYDADGRRSKRSLREKDRKVEQYGKDEIHQRPGQDDDHSLVERKTFKGSTAI